MGYEQPILMDKPAFLHWVQEHEGRYELAERRVVMMTGGTRWHAVIVSRLVGHLLTHLDPARWIAVTEFGVDIGPGTVRYPDVLVEPTGRGGQELLTSMPVLIAEVLSPSSVALDLGDKAAEYLRLASLTAYIVLSQDEPKAWVWMRGNVGFHAGPAVISGRDQSIDIAPLGVSLPLAAIYAGIGDS